MDVAQSSHECPQACAVLPWLPYEGLFPEMLPFSHPANLLLMPIHVLRHQDLRGRNTRERKEDRMSVYTHTDRLVQYV